MKQKMIEFFQLIFGFRKFIAWLALFLVGIIFRIVDLINGEQFVDLIKATFGGFILSNGWEHAMTATKAFMSTKLKTIIPAETPKENENE